MINYSTGSRLLIEPQLEEEFLDTSYGYRPGKGPVRAIGRVRQYLDVEMKKWLVTCDIDDFLTTFRMKNSSGFFRISLMTLI
jgi:retron-type reverse transcriptase